MKTAIALLVSLPLAASTALANDNFPQAQGRLDAARSQMFSEFRNIESVSHKERIAILQQAESCIQAATNRDQYRACEDQEKAAREQSNARAKASHEALRARMEQKRQSMAMNRY